MQRVDAKWHMAALIFFSAVFMYSVFRISWKLYEYCHADRQYREIRVRLSSPYPLAKKEAQK
jgi:hypothetical protein